MEQLIFVGIIVLFSILEAVARKGRAKQGEEEGIPLPPEPKARPPRPRPTQPTGTIPHSYDEDPSFDEAATAEETRLRLERARADEGRVRPEPAAERAAPLGDRSAPPRTSSEGLIPAEVWDEIQRMARGEAPQGQGAPPPAPIPQMPAPIPAPVPRRPEESRPAESRPAGWPKPSPPRPRPSGEPRPSERAGAPTKQPRAGKGLGRAPAKTVEAAPPTEGTADHPVHLAHATYGTPPAARAGIPVEGARRHAPSAAATLRKLLLSDRGSLRQAMVLQEILGPPPGLGE